MATPQREREREREGEAGQGAGSGGDPPLLPRAGQLGPSWAACLRGGARGRWEEAGGGWMQTSSKCNCIWTLKRNCAKWTGALKPYLVWKFLSRRMGGTPKWEGRPLPGFFLGPPAGVPTWSRQSGPWGAGLGAGLPRGQWGSPRPGLALGLPLPQAPCVGLAPFIHSFMPGLPPQGLGRCRGSKATVGPSLLSHILSSCPGPPPPRHPPGTEDLYL